MRGHEALVDMRRRGVRPAAVWLTDIPPPRLLAGGSQRQWWLCSPNPEWAEVYVEPSDSVLRADLRFLIGMPVHVQMAEEQRMRQFVDAAKYAGALAVYGSSHSFDPHRCESTEVAFTAWERGAGWLA
jgi:hypothetical protein